MLGKSSEGFTLIEVLMVVAIIGILASVSIPQYLRSQSLSRRSEGLFILNSIRSAQFGYFAEFDTYSATDLNLNLVGLEYQSSLFYGFRSFSTNDATTGIVVLLNGNIDNDAIQDTLVLKIDDPQKPSYVALPQGISIYNDDITN